MKNKLSRYFRPASPTRQGRCRATCRGEVGKEEGRGEVREGGGKKERERGREEE